MRHKLLLADDSVTIQRVIELTFADEDIQVVAVSDGDQALARLASDPPDIVLADVGMPGKDGYQVAEHIKRTPGLSHIPVLLLTGAFEPIDQARANAAGCDGVLAKPFEPQMVIGRVRELLERTVRAGAPQAAPAAAVPPPQPQARPSWAGDSVPEPTGAMSSGPWVTAHPVPAPAPVPAARVEPAPASAPLDLDDYFEQLDAAFSSRAAAAELEPPRVSPLTDRSASGAAEAWATPVPEQDDAWDLTLDAAGTDATDLPLTYASPEADFSRVPVVNATSPWSSAAAGEDFTQLAPELDQQWSEPSPTFTSEVKPVEWPAEAMSPRAGSGFVPPPLAVTPSAPWGLPARTPEPVPVPPSPPVAVAPVPAPVQPEAPVPTLPAGPRYVPTLLEAFGVILAAEQSAAGRAPIEWPAPRPVEPPAITEAVIESIVSRVMERMTDRVVRETTADVVSRTAERLVREEIERIKTSIR